MATQQVNVRMDVGLVERLQHTAEALSSQGPGAVTVTDLLREGAVLALRKYERAPRKKKKGKGA